MEQTTLYTEKFFSDQKDWSLNSAREIVPLVLKYVQPKSVVDVGCGLGTFLSVFKEHGIQDILGIDGEYVEKSMLLISQEKFQPMDVSKPFHVNRTFDLAVSLEVAEHISQDAAIPFVDSLTKLAPVILFSAAIPFQGGTNHINEQWPEYWAELFNQKGFIPIDAIRPQIWKNEKVAFWYAQNILMFADITYLKKNNEGFYKAYQETNSNQLSMIHPQQHLDAA